MSSALRSQERQLVFQLFEAGLAAANGQRCVMDYLTKHPLDRAVAVIAIGKAASGMTCGARDAPGEYFTTALVISRYGHISKQLSNDPRMTCIEAAHPIPDERSLLAGRALCHHLAQLPDGTDLLILISGGTSSLVEVLADGVHLEDLVRANEWLLASGLRINTVNRVRSRLSQIKGGGLLRYTRGRATTVLLLSDVPGDAPSVIGSGLLVPDTSNTLSGELPAWLGRLGHDKNLSDMDDKNVQHHIIATNRGALLAAADRGRARGYAVTLSSTPLTGDAQQAGESIARQLQSRSPGIYLWGGETTVTLPDNAGSGGRNTHLALSAAHALRDAEDIVILAAGTDGTDGNTSHAGAIIDASTCVRGANCGQDAMTCLLQADSGSYLEACQDLLDTGPTGTNVMDMVIAIKGKAHSKDR